MSTARIIRLVCPACERGSELWESVLVPGWQSCRAFIDENGRRRSEYVRQGSPDREVDWSSPIDQTGEMGCSCGWEGMRSELVQLGIDGKPLPEVHPAQERFA